MKPDGWFRVMQAVGLHERGNRVTLFDDDALNDVVANFEEASAEPNFPGILVDFGHSSIRGGSSEAAGWISELRNDGKGYVRGWISWSDIGRSAVLGGRYTSLSPAVGSFQDADGLLRPNKLASVALTNSPEFEDLKLDLSNRDFMNEIDYRNELCAFLGLSPNASDDAIKAELARRQLRASRATVTNSASSGLAWSPVWSGGLPQVAAMASQGRPEPHPTTLNDKARVDHVNQLRKMATKLVSNCRSLGQAQMLGRQYGPGRMRDFILAEAKNRRLK